jgi:hypothetical protein
VETRVADEGLLVALIEESVSARDRARRLAAALLVEVLRSGTNPADASSLPLERIEAKDAEAVAEQMRALIGQYNLGRSPGA